MTSLLGDCKLDDEIPQGTVLNADEEVWIAKAKDALASDEWWKRAAELDSMGREIVERKCEKELEQLHGEGSPEPKAAYLQEFKAFGDMCSQEQIPAVPAGAGTVAWHLMKLISEGAPPDKLRRVVAAINFAHLAAGHTSPTGDVYVQAALQFGERRNQESKNDG